jgi:lysophospholipase L1-like esterase
MSRGSGGLAGAALACGALLGIVVVVTAAAVAAGRSDAPDRTDEDLEAVEPRSEGPSTPGCPAPDAVEATAGEAEPELDYQGASGAPRVAFVGDSTTALAAMPTDLMPDGAIADAFAEDYRIHLEAQFGQTIGDMLDEVETVLDDRGGPPDALVVNLGTNDVIEDTTDWADDLDRLLELVADHPCVLLVTVNESTDAFLGPERTTAASINARIAEAVTAPNVHHVDWNEDWEPESGFTPGIDHFYSVYAPPEALPAELRATNPMGMWVRDGVHQSPEGSVELARRIREVLDQVSTTQPVEP